MSERPGEDARQQRLDALRGLAHEVNAASDEAPESATGARAGLSAPPHVAARQGNRRNRRRALALAGVAALVILGVVGAMVLRAGGFARSAPPAPALTARVVSLQAAGAFSCPTSPVWSPDGKQIAVLALVGASTNNCATAPEVTNIQRFDTSNNDSNTDNNGYGDNNTSGSVSGAYAIIVFDASSGHVARVIKLPQPTTTQLCESVTPAEIAVCEVNPISLESFSWSPDGRTLAAFFTYFYSDQANGPFNDPVYSQERGILMVTPVDSNSAARILFANGRTQTPSNSLTNDSIYAPSRYTWNLATGAASYTAMHYGQYPLTALFAPGYRLGTDGKLTLDQQAQSGGASPWSAGVLVLQGPQGATPYVSYQTSLWLWSSDNRYAAPNVETGAYLSVPGVTATPPANTPGLIGETTLAPPDAATAQALKASIAAHSQAGLARNPSGKLLATLSCARTGAGQLTIRSVASGKTLAQASHSYPLTTSSLGCAGDLSPIAWSPDGARIVASDSSDGQLIVWQVNIHE